MLICGMCGGVAEKLANSHIYPASMTREQSAGSELVAAKPERGHVVIATAGLRDRIVCTRCEQLFHPFDDEGIRFRRRALKLEGLVGFRHESIRLPTLRADASKLHTFALQTVLRAALSNHTPDVPVSELTQWTANRLLDGRPTVDDGPEVFIRIIRGDLGAVSMDPALHQDATPPCYILHMPNMTIFVARDVGGKLDRSCSHMTLRAGTEVTIWRSRIELYELARITDGVAPVAAEMRKVFKKLERSSARRKRKQ